MAKEGGAYRTLPHALFRPASTAMRFHLVPKLWRQKILDRRHGVVVCVVLVLCEVDGTDPASHLHRVHPDRCRDGGETWIRDC